LQCILLSNTFSTIYKLKLTSQPDPWSKLSLEKRKEWNDSCWKSFESNSSTGDWIYVM